MGVHVWARPSRRIGIGGSFRSTESRRSRDRWKPVANRSQVGAQVTVAGFTALTLFATAPAAALATGAARLVPRVPPTNLCGLTLAAQLKALGASGSCERLTAAVLSQHPYGGGEIFGAEWRTAEGYVELQIWAALPSLVTAFEAGHRNFGAPVIVGSWARERTSSAGADLAAWANNAGIVITVSRTRAGSSGVDLEAPTLALARAVSAQI